MRHYTSAVIAFRDMTQFPMDCRKWLLTAFIVAVDHAASADLRGIVRPNRAGRLILKTKIKTHMTMKRTTSLKPLFCRRAAISAIVLLFGMYGTSAQTMAKCEWGFRILLEWIPDPWRYLEPTRHKCGLSGWTPAPRRRRRNSFASRPVRRYRDMNGCRRVRRPQHNSESDHRFSRH